MNKFKGFSKNSFNLNDLGSLTNPVMNIKMRVTTNGRITIPKEIREELGFVPGTNLDFVVQGDEISLTKATDKPSRGEEIVARISGSGTANLDLTTDEIMAMMRGWDEDEIDR